MKQKELEKILRVHKKWLEGKGGEMADLSSEDLRGLDLRWANLRRADLRRADLNGVDLNGADLNGADLTGADLRMANLHSADLIRANLYGASLDGADLRMANLHGASLRDADLSGADLRMANLEYAIINQATTFSKKESIRKGMILAKPMVGYKKTQEGVIIKAEIPAGAMVFSINNRKCRANMAKIIDMGGKKILHSIHDSTFTYKKGQKIVITDFDLNPSAECSTGFHFFRTRKAAKEY
jgi:uncharacterized protein YjbI with pentapeptide repeats